MTYFIKATSLGFLDDTNMFCPIWQVVSETAFGTEFTDFDTLDEAVSFMQRNPDDQHMVQGLNEEECAISDLYTLDDLEEVKA